MRSVALLAVVVGVTPVKAQEKRTMTVGQLFELIESNSKTLRQQKTSVEFASKEIDAARSQRLPDINTSLSVSYNGNVLIADRDFSDAHGYSVPHFGNSFAVEAVRQGRNHGLTEESGITDEEARRAFEKIWWRSFFYNSSNRSRISIASGWSSGRSARASINLALAFSLSPICS